MLFNIFENQFLFWFCKILGDITFVSCVISNEAFELHIPKLLATNEKTHASFRIAPNTY